MTIAVRYGTGVVPWGPVLPGAVNSHTRIRVTLIAETVESAPMQYTNCWKSAIRPLTVTE